MQLKTRTPRDFINALLSKKAIHPAPFAAFKQALADFVQATKDQHANGQTEPNMVTSALKPFIDSLGYTSNPHSQKGQIGIDLVIQQNGKPAVIIEAKRPSSRDMMTEQDINKKAFHEAVYYFMRERDAGNDGLTSVVVTDFDNWFVFDAKDFERLFWDNAIIQKIYQTHKNPHLLSNTTADFYQTLEAALPKQHVDLVSPTVIECAHFNLLLTYSDKELAAIYKLLSADSLLKVFNPNDANSLNREFYNELLYILGLEEVKQGGKKLIDRSHEPQAGSLYENTSDKLAQYYKTNDFEAVIKLLIIWINRILFLKFLESQIVTWTDQKNHKFLLPSKISDYVSLENLFFNILAKKIQDQGSNQFDYIPYLNSSLFEVHADELKGITIATLAGDAQMDYYNKTVVKDNLSHKKTGKVNTLAYLFEFLDAYDFANDSKDEITTDNKSLVSASVLGLIFEKINGYKDGSFYTPSFVTMYMAKETIEKTVLQKFNLAKNWECKTLIELDNKLDVADIVESNAIINDIKICDPAVGSGHFLVSALNEILRIKSLLGILMDESSKRIKDYAVTIENDELILKDFEDGTFFEYKKGHFEKTRIQKTLFKEKQKIIESCLFGVDINPNSVNICRLRLWVELLKNAYYKPDGTLDTLPNIDINIKCGNSLISRFGIKDDLKSRGIQAEIKDYKDKVIQYKQNIGSKRDVAQAIEALKTKFSETLKAGHGSSRGLRDVLGKYVSQFGLADLTPELRIRAMNWSYFGKQAQLIDEENNDATKNQITIYNQLIDLQAQALEVESGVIYKNAFEWRFEFPEVLNDIGEFIGFDIIIGNPPYFSIDTFGAKSAMLQYFPKNYGEIYMDKSDILFYFLARATELSSANTAYIISNAMLFSDKAKKLRNYLLTQNPIEKIINFERYQVFDEASITAMMIFLSKTHTGLAQAKNFTEALYDKKSLIKQLDKNDDFFDVQFEQNNVFPLVDFKISSLNKKIDAAHPICEELFHLGSGMQTAANEVFTFKEYPEQFDSSFIKYRMTGDIIDKYHHTAANEYILYVEEAEKFSDLPKNIQNYLRKNKSNLDARAEITRNKTRLWWKYTFPMHKEYYQYSKIWCAYRAKENIFCLDESVDFIGLTNTTVIFATNADIDIKYALALLNSKVLNYRYKSIGKQTGSGIYEYFESQVSKLPIPKIDKKQQKPFITKVNSIMAAKKNGADTAKLEQELNNLIYKLYDLTLDEIKTIDPESTLTAAQYEALE